MDASGSPALRHAAELGLSVTLVQHHPVTSLEEAAAARGIAPRDLIKTLVVRRGDDDFLFVLIPGGRQISWPKLRELLGVSRLSMPDAATALAVTGYPRGTITPLGSSRPWPVIVDADATGRTISIGAGLPNAGLSVAADALVAALEAQVADVSSAG